jgi:superfamily I DNA/RNA helicase
MANALISHNASRIAGRVMTERPENGPGEVVVRQYVTAEQEAEAVASKIASLIASGVAPGEIIVLTQRETFAVPIFDKLRDQQIPTKSYYAESELDTIEAQERFALLKLLLDNEDRVALRWLLGRGHADWRAKPYRRVMAHVNAHGISPWLAMCALAADTLAIPHTTPLVERFREIQLELAVLNAAPDLEHFIQAWLPASEGTTLLTETVEKCKEGLTTTEALYEALYDAITHPEIPSSIAEVRIMSLHKSKGLSSPFVFIVGCVEGLHPAKPDTAATPDEQHAKLEEDRRLFYVGISRVKSALPGRVGYLALTYARTMAASAAYSSQIAPVFVDHGVAHLHASRFLADMAPHVPAALANASL